MFVNPVSMASLAQIPTQKDKIFKFLVELQCLEPLFII